MEIEHALSCRNGGLPIRRHIEVRTLLASCLRKAGCDTAIEPQLQPLSGEVFLRQTTTADQEACLDIKDKGFFFLGGGESEEALFFLMSRCSTRSCPRTASCHFLPFSRGMRMIENRDCYEDRVREVERAAFTPLVLAATGGAGKLTTAFLKRLAVIMAEKGDEAYCTTMAWLRARLAFSLLQSAIACLRSMRRKVSCEANDLQPALATGLAGRRHWKPSN